MKKRTFKTYYVILTDCWRDHGALDVWGGVIWGDEISNNHFLESHGVVTPDFFWKVIKFGNGEVNAWLMPNDETPTRSKMNNYLVTPNTLTILTGIAFC